MQGDVEGKGGHGGLGVCLTQRTINMFHMGRSSPQTKPKLSMWKWVPDPEPSAQRAILAHMHTNTLMLNPVCPPPWFGINTGLKLMQAQRIALQHAGGGDAFEGELP